MKRHILTKAKEEGLELDEKLVNHLSYLLVRENLCIFEDYQENQNPNSTAHFEAFQSSNWNDVRFKPPPSLDSSIGWRVELRSIDIQIMPEQNFLFTHSVLVLFRLLQEAQLGLNLYIPMSLVSFSIAEPSIITFNGHLS